MFEIGGCFDTSDSYWDTQRPYIFPARGWDQFLIINKEGLTPNRFLNDVLNE